MNSVHAKVRLRPINLAFLVDPSDVNSILSAIQINTCLWGGTFNSLIPIYERLPPSLKAHTNLNAERLTAGYLEAFEPDYVVRTDEFSTTFSGFRDCDVVSAAEILANIDHGGVPHMGSVYSRF